MFGWAYACWHLGLGDRARELDQLLAPFSDQIATGGSVIYGSIASALGRLAAAFEDYERAEAHFAAGAEIEERLGAPLFLARTRVDWARALIARARSEDLERATRMLEHADETARGLGGNGIAREVADCRSALAAIGS